MSDCGDDESRSRSKYDGGSDDGITWLYERGYISYIYIYIYMFSRWERAKRRGKRKETRDFGKKKNNNKKRKIGTKRSGRKKRAECQVVIVLSMSPVLGNENLK